MEKAVKPQVLMENGANEKVNIDVTTTRTTDARKGRHADFGMKEMQN